MSEDEQIPSELTGLAAEIDRRRRQIFTDGYPVSIGELTNLYRDGELDIHPEFQRFFRWTTLQRSRLIESLLLGIPIPSIFVNQRPDGVWDVVDGLQRLSTIFEFQGLLRHEDGSLYPPSRLEGTTYLPSLERKVWESEDTAESLMSAQRLLIKRASIDVKIIKRESDPNAKFDLFQRLNTGGSQLSPQELRNCLLIMVDPTYYRWLLELRNNDDFQLTTAPSERAVEEQYDLELVVRFLALVDATAYDLREIDDMGEFLTAWAVSTAENGEYDRATAAARFGATFGLLAEALGDDAFRRYDAAKGRFLGGFSVSAFEALSVGVASSLPAWTALPTAEAGRLVSEKVQRLWGEEVYKTRSGSGVRASGRVPYTIPLGRDLFKPE